MTTTMELAQSLIVLLVAGTLVNATSDDSGSSDDECFEVIYKYGVQLYRMQFGDGSDAIEALTGSDSFAVYKNPRRTNNFLSITKTYRRNYPFQLRQIEFTIRGAYGAQCVGFTGQQVTEQTDNDDNTLPSVTRSNTNAITDLNPVSTVTCSTVMDNVAEVRVTWRPVSNYIVVSNLTMHTCEKPPSIQSVTYKTLGNGTFQFVDLLPTLTSVTFNLHACSDAVVRLHDSDSPKIPYKVEIYHGDLNVRFRKGNDKLMDTRYDEEQILDCAESKPFWLAWNRTFLAFGTGSTLYRDNKASGKFNLRPGFRISVGTFNDSHGIWTFDAKFIEQEHSTCPYTLPRHVIYEFGDDGFTFQVNNFSNTTADALRGSEKFLQSASATEFGFTLTVNDKKAQIRQGHYQLRGGVAVSKATDNSMGNAWNVTWSVDIAAKFQLEGVALEVCLPAKK